VIVFVLGWSLIAAGSLMALHAFAEYTASKNPLPWFAVAAVELVFGIAAASGRPWGYLTARFLAPLDLIGSVGVLVLTTDLIFVLPVGLFAVLTFLMFVPAGPGQAVRRSVADWLADRRRAD
jgi:hypothetical protein